MNVSQPLSYLTCHLPDGQPLAYIDAGRGPAILLLHGFTGTAENTFAALLPTLAASHRVLAPDLRGYGRSRPPAREFTPDFYRRDADDGAALLGQLGVERATVLGFSDGAESALLLAARHPDAVERVIAWGVSGVISAEMLGGIADWLQPAAWATRHPAWAAEIAAQQGADQIEPLVRGWAVAAHAIHASGGNICLHEAASIRCPVLLINGEREVGNTRRDVDALAARIPACRLDIVANAGHAVHEDQPELFLELVRGFLSA